MLLWSYQNPSGLWAGVNQLQTPRLPRMKDADVFRARWRQAAAQQRIHHRCPWGKCLTLTLRLTFLKGNPELLTPAPTDLVPPDPGQRTTWLWSEQAAKAARRAGSCSRGNQSIELLHLQKTLRIDFRHEPPGLFAVSDNRQESCSAATVGWC